jgi:proline dehydrogenase
MLRSVILAASRSSRIERLVATAPVSRDVVRRFVAGVTAAEALRATRELVADGLAVSLDHLGEDTLNPTDAARARDEYVALVGALAQAELTAATEVSLKLSALGQRLDEQLAYDYAATVCAAAAEAGTAVTLDMEDHTTTDSTIEILTKLRQDFPATGVALQSYLRRTEADCRDLAGPGSRVRLCKGAYAEPESVAYQAKLEVDRSYVRCLNILMSGEGYPMIATHDPRLIAIGEDRAKWFDRAPDQFEFQMLYGVRPAEQLRLVDEGYTVRVYLPYGTQWYGYLMRRLAERPANLGFFARALRSRR